MEDAGGGAWTVLLSPLARRQIAGLISYYRARDRSEAVIRLQETVLAAADRIAAAPLSGMPYPRPYRNLAALGHRWIKVGRYWFAFRSYEARSFITNVLFESADILRRAR